MRISRLPFWLAGLVVLASCGPRDPEPPLGPVTIKLKTTVFSDGASIPARYTCDGGDISPPLSWSGVPEKAASLALVCDDPDAPMGTWTHWLVYNLEPTVASLPEGLPASDDLALPNAKPAIQGKNDFGKPGYGGPCPPSGTHRYVFRLYALDAPLKLVAGATKAQLMGEIKGHVVAEGRLIGKYSRQK